MDVEFFLSVFCGSILLALAVSALALKPAFQKSFSLSLKSLSSKRAYFSQLPKFFRLIFVLLLYPLVSQGMGMEKNYLIGLVLFVLLIDLATSKNKV